MALEKIVARTKEKPNPVEAEYDFGDGTLKGLASKFGEDVIASRAKAALVIDIQALMRRHIESKDFDPAKMRKAVAEFKPTVSNGVRRSASERIEDSLSKMSPDEQKALLARLQEQVKSGGVKPAAAAAAQGGGQKGGNGQGAGARK